MYRKAKTLDDLLHDVFARLLKSTNRIKPTRGPAVEITGALLEISDPRIRLSRTEAKGTVFSCLGELFWYLAKSDSLEFISYYISQYLEETDDGKTIYGAYGPRLFGVGRYKENQLDNVIKILRDSPDSRRAVIQLFSPEDISHRHKEIPCTCTLQFFIRRNRLHMFVSMRSNDAFKGLPHDVFAFTMIQEIVARTLGCKLGAYKHAVGSLHLYDEDREKVQGYISEGWQSTTVAMPMMPNGDPWPSINTLISIEEKIRTGEDVNIESLELQSYWLDLVRLLQIYSYIKRKQYKKIPEISRSMSSPIYEAYIRRKQKKKQVKAESEEQLDLMND